MKIPALYALPLCTLPLCTLPLWAALGCTGTDAPDYPRADSAVVESLRSEFTLGERPTDAMGVMMLHSGGDDETGESAIGGPVTIEGVVGGMPSPYETEPHFPWRPGEATFFLVDTTTAAEFEEHAGEDDDHLAHCAQCARAAEEKAATSVVVVSFVDDEGNPRKVDARQLFNLQANDKVVVQGEAEQLAGGILLVKATGLWRAT